MKRFIGSLIGFTVIGCVAAFAKTSAAALTSTPEPGTMMMMATGLVSGAGYLISKRRKQ